MIGLVRGEQDVEVLVAQAVGMLALRLEGHQVHDVDDADLQVGKVLAQHLDGGQRFERGHIAGAGHHYVGVAALDRCWPIPRCRGRRCSV